MKTITRQLLADAVYLAAPNVSRDECRDILEQVLGEIAAAVIAGEPVLINNFGIFRRHRMTGTGPTARNPRRPTELHPIRHPVRMTFRSALGLRDRVNRGRRA